VKKDTNRAKSAGEMHHHAMSYIITSHYPSPTAHRCSHVLTPSTLPTFPIWILWNEMEQIYRKHQNIWKPSGFYNTLKVYDDIAPFF